MNKTMIRVLGAATLCMAIAAILVVGIVRNNQRINQQKMDEEAAQLKQAYYTQNSAFGNYYSKYMPSLRNYSDNEDGIYYRVYFYLAYYEKSTGIHLGYEQILDYLSQEFEDDGDIRIYNNGRHPEVEAYVVWLGENKDMAEQYIERILDISSQYCYSFIGKGLTPKAAFRNRYIMDEYIKKEADPDYVMDERIMWEGLPYGPYSDE